MVYKVFDVLQGSRGDVCQRFTREESLVGRDDDVVERKQACQRVVIDNLVRLVFVEVLAFFLVYIQSRRTDFLVLQSFNQGVGMNQLPAPGVDNHNAVFHLTDGIIVDEVFGLFRQGAVQGNDIGAVV